MGYSETQMITRLTSQHGASLTPFFCCFSLLSIYRSELIQSHYEISLSAYHLPILPSLGENKKTPCFFLPSNLSSLLPGLVISPTLSPSHLSPHVAQSHSLCKNPTFPPGGLGRCSRVPVNHVPASFSRL